MVRSEKAGKKPAKPAEPYIPAHAAEAGAAPAFAGAAAYAAPVAASSAVLSGTVGNPGRKHFDYAEKLRNSMPVQLLDALHSPEGARYAVYALLMGSDAASISAAAGFLSKTEGAKVATESGTIAELIAPLGPGARLPLIDLSMPALRKMDAEAVTGFMKTVDGLVMLDREVSLFEFALTTMLRARLMPARSGADKTRYRSIWGVEAEARVLLSAMADAGSGDTASSYARALGVLGLKPGDGPIPPERAVSLLHDSLEKLALSDHPLKKKLVEACAECVLADGQVDPTEGELLRAVCERLGIPMPPILAEAG